MFVFLFGSFLVVVMVGFLGVRIVVSFISWLCLDIFNYVMDYFDVEIKWFFIFFLLMCIINDLI